MLSSDHTETSYWIPAITKEIVNLKNYGVWKMRKMTIDAIPVKGKFVFKW